ncbi:MAG: 1,4-dihydroxy-6-naphthoate synthase [Thermodesulfobacteriota bacterium]
MNPLSLAFSPCPNDTYIFCGLVHNRVSRKGINFLPPRLEDVETLNEWALEGRFDVTKLSFHALGHVLDDYCVLTAGSALGRGCGPLLVARKNLDLSQPGKLRVAIPGRLTTAAMLFRLFLPDCTDLVTMRFDTIMAAVERGDVDAGVIIHESRFTYSDYGLSSICDLGQWWEESSGLPIPLGCIGVRRSLGTEVISRIDRLIGSSLDWATGHPSECQPYIRQYAQEMDVQVLAGHISLYVNDFSRDLGEEGQAAIMAFLQRGRSAGILPAGPAGVEVFDHTVSGR